MTQHQLIIEYIKLNGSILPAKVYGSVFKDVMFGSETSKRCRELRSSGLLESVKEGKFERFYLKGQTPQNDIVTQFFKDFPPKLKVGEANTLF